MKCVLSLLLVIATPTLGQYQLSDVGGYGYQDQDPMGPSGFRNNFDGYGSQFQGVLPGLPGRNRGPHGNEVLSSSEYGHLGPEPASTWDNRIPDVTGGSHRSPSRGRDHRGPRRHGRGGRNEVDSDSGSDYDSSMDRDRHDPQRRDFKDTPHVGWEFENRDPLRPRRGRRNNGRGGRKRPSRRRDSSSEGSSASSRSSQSQSSSEEVTRGRGRYGRNRYDRPHLGPGVITFPGIDLGNMRGLFDGAFGAGQDLLNEAGTQGQKLGERITGTVRDGLQTVTSGITNGVNGTKVQNLAEKVTGATGLNAITLDSFKQPDFVKQLLQNIYYAMKSWGEVLKQLPGNIWNRFESMINCLKGQCNDFNIK